MHKIITFSKHDQDLHLKQFNKLHQEIYGKEREEYIPSRSTCYLTLKGTTPLARLSTNITTDLHGLTHLCGMIGHYDAIDSEAGINLLKRAKEDLIQEGAAFILGPMNGSTWNPYRLAIEPEQGDPSFDPAVFMGEPKNPSAYLHHFSAAGFSIIDRYESRITHHLNCREKEGHRLQSKMDRLGIVMTSLEPSRFEAELHDIYNLNISTFAKNRFYRQIDYIHFKMLYEEIKPYLDTDLVLLARDKKQRLVGFAFAYPDMNCVLAKKPMRLIFKTLAVEKEMRPSGLGVYLQDALHIIAHRKQYHSVIHALMHSDNNSLKLSEKGYNSELFKRYVLMGASPE